MREKIEVAETSNSLTSAEGAVRAPLAASDVRIGLIGVGAIGREVARLLKGGHVPFEIVALTRRATTDANVKNWVNRTEDLIAARPLLAVEAAGHAAVSEHVIPLLQAGIPVVLASSGALANDELRCQVTQAAQAGKTRLIFPSGAIGALDYIQAVSHSANFRIRYCSRKPAAAWHDELVSRGLVPDRLDREVVLFEGPAREAALSFPQNLNVAMSLALAGPGIDRVEVRVIADPKVTGNTHEIEVESVAGQAMFIFNNAPSPDNPKTSALTALSIVHAVGEYLETLDAER